MASVGAPVALPPGTILQQLYLRERLVRLRAGRFVEVGVGRGQISRILLDLGWSGRAYDLSQEAVEQAHQLNVEYVERARYRAYAANWLASPDIEPADLVISSMVLEHLDARNERRYFDRAAEVLAGSGTAILLVPGSPRHWGIEDEIAGHFRRYTAETMREIVSSAGWSVRHLAGLTYPVSNILLGVSNCLVGGAEARKRDLSLADRTLASGVRTVPWKTHFPPWTRTLLNERALRPAHRLQKLFARSPRALVLYCECEPPRSDAR
ncbi:MAG: class I SAM-dependent methyltransferase [Solirubrobacteraceae bacterium]